MKVAQVIACWKRATTINPRVFERYREGPDGCRLSDVRVFSIEEPGLRCLIVGGAEDELVGADHSCYAWRVVCEGRNAMEGLLLDPYCHYHQHYPIINKYETLIIMGFPLALSFMARIVMD